MARQIKIEIYTYTARRVYLYAPKPYDKLLRPITLKRKEYDFYSKAIINVFDAIKALGFEDKINLRIRPWFFWFWKAGLHGAFKTPVIIIDGHLFSKGEIPDISKLKAKLAELDHRETFLRR